MTVEALIRRVHRHLAKLPCQPLTLGPGVHVAQPERFYRTLAADIAGGPSIDLRNRPALHQRWLPLLQYLADLHSSTERVTEGAAA